VNQGGLRRGYIRQPQGINQQVIGRGAELLQGALHCQAGGGQDPQCINLRRGCHPHRPVLHGSPNHIRPALPLARGHQLGIMHPRQPGADGRIGRQNDRRSRHRTRPGAAPGFIQPGNRPGAVFPQGLLVHQPGRWNAAHGW